MILEFNEKCGTKFIFVLNDDVINVVKYYNGRGYTCDYECDTKMMLVPALSKLVERIKAMPDEMWNVCDVERVKSKKLNLN